MKTIGFFLGAILAISVLTAGCQSASLARVKKTAEDGGPKSDLPKQDVSKVSLGGSWVSGCRLDEKSAELYRLDTISFVSNRVELLSEYFSDLNCKTPMFVQSMAGNFELSSEAITISYDILSVIPQSSIIAISFNQFEGFCGLKDWELSKMKFFNDLSRCGFSEFYKSKIARFGKNELFLDSKKFTLK